MSRNPEYQFVSTDTEKLISLLVSGYEKITKTTLQPGSPDRVFIQWVANIILYERELNNYTGNQNIPSRAEGDNLDALGELFYLHERPEATASTCTMRFSISQAQEHAILVPAGTRVTDVNTTLYWNTLEDEYIPAGATYADISVTCQTTGTAGNGYAVGQINTIVDVFDYYTSCENITESANGSDAPDDDEFYELLVASQDAYSTAGPYGAYVYLAKAVSNDVADVVANSPEPGVACIYAIMSDGSLALDETKTAMVEACTRSEHRPMTDKVISADPDVIAYNVDLTYYMTRGSSLSASAAKAAAEEAVDEYVAWQCAKMGRDINPDKLRNLLLNAGIKRVDIAQPTFTHLEDGKPSDDLHADKVPQIAQVGTISINSGGYEDE